MRNLGYEKRIAGGMLLVLLVVEFSVVILLNWLGLVDGLPYSISCLMSEMLIIVPAILMMGIWYIIHLWKVSVDKDKEDVGFGERLMYKKAKLSTFLVTVIFTLLIMPSITFCNGVSMLFTENVVIDEVDMIVGQPLPLALFFVAFVPAMCEEFAFRGVIYGGFRRCCRPAPAVFVSALLFGLMHLNINQFCYAFPMGIIAALLVEATGSIWSSIIMHFGINAVSVFSMFAFNISNEDMISESTLYDSSNLMVVSELMIYGVIALITIFLASLLLVWFAKNEKRDNPLILIRDSRTYKGINILSLPLILSILLSVGIMIFVK